MAANKSLYTHQFTHTSQSILQGYGKAPELLQVEIAKNLTAIVLKIDTFGIDGEWKFSVWDCRLPEDSAWGGGMWAVGWIEAGLVDFLIVWSRFFNIFNKSIPVNIHWVIRVVDVDVTRIYSAQFSIVPIDSIHQKPTVPSNVYH